MTALEYAKAHRPIGTACGVAAIQHAESILKVAFPEELQELYLQQNGFYGPTECAYLMPLTKHLGYDGLVDYTMFIWAEEWCPAFVKRCLVFGMDGCGTDFLIDVSSKAVMRWQSEWGDDFEVANDGMLGLWTRTDADYRGSAK